MLVGDPGALTGVGFSGLSKAFFAACGFNLILQRVGIRLRRENSDRNQPTRDGSQRIASARARRRGRIKFSHTITSRHASKMPRWMNTSLATFAAVFLARKHPYTAVWSRTS